MERRVALHYLRTEARERRHHAKGHRTRSYRGIEMNKDKIMALDENRMVTDARAALGE